MSLYHRWRGNTIHDNPNCIFQVGDGFGFIISIGNILWEAKRRGILEDAPPLIVILVFAASSTPETLFVLPHSRKTFVSPGAEPLPELQPREAECRCHGRWVSCLPFIVLRNWFANYKRRIPSCSFLNLTIRDWVASLLTYMAFTARTAEHPVVSLLMLLYRISINLSSCLLGKSS